MSNLSLDQANTIVAAALAKGMEMGLNPLSVAALDSGGHLVAFQRQDGSSILRFEIASGKAFGCLAVGAGSRWLNAQAESRPHFLEGLSNVSGGRVIAVPGGALVRDTSGAIIGAVGISGDTSDNDEACVLAGIEAAGLSGDAG
jgi:uncharacterized protein GlcG (DUF336 family)